ncbi:MAG TPA: hypothetical protein VHE30_13755 [Polyangiaceae bacterium]|nr:hypothetical protein [Polyangiaceae bacterium]
MVGAPGRRVSRAGFPHFAARAGFLAGALLVGSQRTAEAAETTFWVAPEFGVQAGVETYELSLSIPQSDSSTLTAESKLSYPVETVMAGGGMGLTAGAFSVSALVLSNVVDPWGTMTDQDFATLSAFGASQRLEFSHTDSRTTLRALVLEGALRYAFQPSEPGARPGFYGTAGLRYEGSHYEVFGASGWHLDSNANRAPTNIPDDVKGLEYDVHHFFPFVGAGTTYRSTGSFVVDAEARLILSTSTHRDDHVLRRKLGEANTIGVGGALVVEPAVVLGKGDVQPRLGVHGEIQWVTGVSGKLRQHYYEDDPTIDGDQLGVAIPDSDFSFTSLRARLLAFFALGF